MERRAVAVVDSEFLIKNDISQTRDFVRFCAEWLKKHSKNLMDIKMAILYLGHSDKKEDVSDMLNSFVSICKEKGIDAESKTVSSVEELKKEIEGINPEVVFTGNSKLAGKVRDVPGLFVSYSSGKRNKQELRKVVAYGIAAFLIYSTIFHFFNVIKTVTTEKNPASVVLILGTVIAVAYFYGNTISHILSYLGLKHGHAH